MLLTLDEIKQAETDSLITDVANYLYEHMNLLEIRQELASEEGKRKLQSYEGLLEEAIESNRYVLACKLALDWKQILAELEPKPISAQGRADAQELKQRVDMVDVASRYTEMTGSQDNKHGRCPIHGGDKHDAFFVSSSKQLGFCHTCGWRGDVYKLVMDMEHMEFVDAVRWVNDNFI